MKTMAILTMVVATVAMLTGCSLEVVEAPEQVGANDDCYRIALDGSGYCVDEDDPAAKRTVEMCGPDSDDVFMLCRSEDDQ